MLKIGSHVNMSAPDYLLQACKDAISYDANSFMIYSGAPQNTRRIPVDKFKIAEAKAYMQENNFDYHNIILHAPYIINLANTVKLATYELAVEFLIKEIERAQAMGIDIIVLHPGAHVGAGVEAGLQQIVKGLDEVFSQIDMKTTKIALETMAGKGTELGRTFEELAYIIEHVQKSEHLGVCLDTCHIHDGGYDLSDFDQVLQHFDEVIGLDRLIVLHINDSKNVKGAHKDRHANLGEGEIGIDNLMNVIYHPKLEHLVKILETPWIDDKPPYKEEIALIRSYAKKGK